MRWLIYIPLFVLPLLTRGVAGWDKTHGDVYNEAGLQVYEWNAVCPPFVYRNPPCLNNVRSDPLLTYKFSGGGCPYPANRECLQAYVRMHRSSEWSVGNEPDDYERVKGECWAGDCLTAEQAVRQYGTLIHDIRDADPNAVIACCSWVWSHIWLADKMELLWPTIWNGQTFTQAVDIVAWHVYADFVVTSTTDIDLMNNFNSQLAIDVAWAAARNKQLWLTEVGIHPAYTPPEAQPQMLRLIPMMCASMRQAKVARAYWFVGLDQARWGEISILDRNGNLSPTGLAWNQC